MSERVWWGRQVARHMRHFRFSPLDQSVSQTANEGACKLLQSERETTGYEPLQRWMPSERVGWQVARASEPVSGRVSAQVSGRVSEQVSGRLSEQVSGRVSEQVSEPAWWGRQVARHIRHFRFSLDQSVSVSQPTSQQ